MAESHKAVLDREQSVKDAKRFNDSLDLLNVLLDYGTNLIPRAFVSSPRDLKDFCIIFVQLRQFLAHLDGVVTLATARGQERDRSDKREFLPFHLIRSAFRLSRQLKSPEVCDFVTGLQVRALPGAYQVPEPIGWR